MSVMPQPVVLLVEDEPLLLLDVEETVKEAGFDAVSTSDPHAAMKELEADCSRFSALVTDVDLGNADISG